MILFAVTFPKEKGHSFECPLLSRTCKKDVFSKNVV